MQPYNQDNIVALATPPGKGALAVIRFSGKNLFSLYKSFTHKTPKNRYALYSKVYHPYSGFLLDEALVTYFKSPNSFTGEDMIEISCHGGINVRGSIVKAAVESGARLAEPGEFSLRSFLNGKMDLLQAEAISSLINSKSSLSLEISLEHLSGKISGVIKSLKKDAINLLSIIENELNFSEEEIVPIKTSKIISDICNIKDSVDSLLKSSIIGKNIFSGIRVIIYGKPNSGKSTLFNAILGHDRAITSSIPGTTRDSLESWFELEGVPVCLVDTAGIWNAKNELDSLSIKQTLYELKRADICILLDEIDPCLLLDDVFNQTYKQHCIMVRSKSDLLSSSSNNSADYLLVSSIKNLGVDELLTMLSTRIVESCSYESDVGVLITGRQRGLLKDSVECLQLAHDQLKSSVGMDIVASTMRGFSLILMEIVGEIPDKDIIENIFKNFCIGK